MTNRAVGGALAALALLPACTGTTNCTAVGWSNTVRVEFADDWPSVDGGVTIECEPACHPDRLMDPRTVTVDPADGDPVAAGLDESRPGSVVVRVLGPDGTALTEVDADLDWRRVGGTEECGGPHEATVVVPAP